MSEHGLGYRKFIKHTMIDYAEWVLPSFVYIQTLLGDHESKRFSKIGSSNYWFNVL